MDKLLGLVSNLAAAVGVLACLAAGVARLFSRYYVANFEAMVVFTLGIALMVFACLIKLYRLELNS